MYKNIFHNKDDKSYVFECPHCELIVQVLEKELNCLIFRHGILKNNNTQINPHLSQNECERLSNDNLIYGCGKPFRLLKNTDNEIYRVEICDYI